MTRLLALLLVSATVATACGPRRSAAPPSGGSTLVVLLPDPDDGSVGLASVSNESGTADLDGARASTSVLPGGAPSPAATLDDARVQEIFGDALSSLPLPPLSFVLFFRFESDELSDESRMLLPEVVKAVANRPAPEVVVVGHTDTTGDPKSNFDLGMTRARAVVNVLMRVGLDRSLIEVESHGEGNPLIRTPDETLEPRNRRVEIAVR